MNLQKTALFVFSKCIVLDARHDWWAWLSWFCTYYDGKNGLYFETDWSRIRPLPSTTLNDASWLQATLPISMGGLGLRLASTSAPVAYDGSLNSTNHLVSLLLDQDHHTPPEEVVSLRIHLKSKALSWMLIQPHRNPCRELLTLQLYLAVRSLPP